MMHNKIPLTLALRSRKKNFNINFEIQNFKLNTFSTLLISFLKMQREIREEFACFAREKLHVSRLRTNHLTKHLMSQ